MNAITIESLGLSKESISDRIVDQAVERLLFNLDDTDEYGNVTGQKSKFQDQMNERIRSRIDAAVDAIAAKHVLPNVEIYLETLCLQETNTWGEKRGAKLTFVEYLVGRAERYLTEEVDHEGKGKGENTWGNWNKKSTRVAYLVHKHLQYNIETAMKQAIADANTNIVGGIEQAVKIKLAEVAASLKVSVAVPK